MVFKRAAALAVLAGSAYACWVPECEKAIVAFPPQEYTVATFTKVWRPLCSSACSAQTMHYGFEVNTTGVPSVLSVDCYCCTKNPATGKCWNESNPYSATDIWGPVSYPTHDLISSVVPKVVEINRRSCSVKPTTPFPSVPVSKPTKPATTISKPCTTKRFSLPPLHTPSKPATTISKPCTTKGFSLPPTTTFVTKTKTTPLATPIKSKDCDKGKGTGFGAGSHSSGSGFQGSGWHRR